MNGFAFFASLVDSLAWPVAAVVVLLLLRDKVAELITLIERFKYKDFELDFRQSVHDLRAQTDEALATILPEDPQPLSNPRSGLNALAEVSPRAAILEAWLLVEKAASEAIAIYAPNVRPTPGMHMIVSELLKKYGILDRAQLEIFRQLRDLRNKAVHISDASLDLNTVSDYIHMALALVEQIGQYRSSN